MATLETFPEGNCDRQTGRQNDKATYKGSSYRSAQIRTFLAQNLKMLEVFEMIL